MYVFIAVYLQPLQRELHVYYHRNTPEPPSSRAGDRGEEGEEAGGAETVEMEFPSGYTDPWPEEENEVSEKLTILQIAVLCRVICSGLH